MNYDAEMLKIVADFNGHKPKLLLHTCCAPCATACVAELLPYFDITLYFYNPNIVTENEYNLRLSNVKMFLDKALLAERVRLIAEKYDNNIFSESVKGYESDPEGGDRCGICFKLRLKKTAEAAKDFDYFTTTLTVSPHKNAEIINETGMEISKKYLVSDFKKRGGYQKSIALSKEYGLYRQTFCGCTPRDMLSEDTL